MNDKKTKAETPALRARQWWSMMTGWPSGHNADRGSLANLRRCRKTVDALMVPATYNLMRRLPKSDQDRIAVLAVVLAHVRQDIPTRVARAIGVPSGEGQALVSENRFRRLLQTQENDELLTNMVRLLSHLKGTANVEDMAKSILYWNDWQRRRWAFDYYGAADTIAKTDDTQKSETEEARP